MEIRQLQPRTYKLKKGQVVSCKNGNLWITVRGQDIILSQGESMMVKLRDSRTVISPIGKKEAELCIMS